LQQQAAAFAHNFELSNTPAATTDVEEMQLQQHVTKLHGGDIVWSCFSLRANLIILHPALSQAYASDVLQGSKHILYMYT